MKHEYSADYKNIALRPLGEGDIEFLRSWRNDPENTRFLSKIPYITPEMQKRWFESYLQDPDELCFAIILAGRVIGSLSLYEFGTEALGGQKDCCLYGKLLIGDKEAHGRQAGLNATIAALKIAFEELGMKIVGLYVYAENKQAFKVYTDAGFKITDCHAGKSGAEEYTMMIRREEFVSEQH